MGGKGGGGEKERTLQQQGGSEKLPNRAKPVIALSCRDLEFGKVCIISSIEGRKVHGYITVRMDAWPPVNVSHI